MRGWTEEIVIRAVDLAATPVVAVTVALVLVLAFSGIAGRVLLRVEEHAPGDEWPEVDLPGAARSRP